MRDKAKDDRMFNCHQPYEVSYVAGLYHPNTQRVHDFLTEKCRSHEIHNSTHKFVYQLIKEKLGYPIPD